MIETKLPLDENLSESFPGMTFEFPYVWIWGEMDKYVGGHVPWHWHEEPEFVMVLAGEIEYHLADEVHILTAGDAMFVNSNVLHMIRSHKDCRGAVIVPQIINKLLLIGYHRSVFDTKYYRPITNALNLPCYVMRQQNPSDVKMLGLLRRCFRCAEKEGPGFEFKVREYMSRVWLNLFTLLQPQLRSHTGTQDKNNERLKIMLRFINTHYAEKISLSEIAGAAMISEREALRCFQKYMQTSPIQYLQEYRIETAANLLLHSDLSITEIALQTGYATSSHFSKTFRDYMHCTPKKYRDTTRQNNKFVTRATNQGIFNDYRRT